MDIWKDFQLKTVDRNVAETNKTLYMAVLFGVQTVGDVLKKKKKVLKVNTVMV